MAAPGIVFTQRTDFGVSNGPTFSGTTVVPATATGTENARVYSAQALNTATTEIDAIGFFPGNLIALGFKMSVDPVQTGAPTPAQLAAATVTVQLVDCVGGVADFEIPLLVGQAVSFAYAPPTITDPCTKIQIVGDGVVDCVVEGIVLLAA